MGEVLYGSYDWAVFDGLEKRYRRALYLSKLLFMLLESFIQNLVVLGPPTIYQKLEYIFVWDFVFSPQDKYYVFCLQ